MRQIILIPDDEGGYEVEVPSLPGCFTYGHTRAEAMERAADVIHLFIETMIDLEMEVPEDIPAPIEVAVV